MRRRQYLMGVGIGIGLGGAFPLGVSQAAAELERVMPDDEVTVQPGTTVLFELAVPDGVEPHDVEWDADDDLGRTVFAGDYASETGNAAFAPSFDTSGSYEVRANPPAGDPVTWTVDVDDEGHGRPVVEELSTEPGTNETVGTDQSVEVTATVYDPAGNLGQVVWIEGRNQTVVDRSSLDGGRDTATLAFEETPSWIDFGYPTAAIVVSDDGRVSDQTSDDGPEVRQPLAVSIVETNDPVGAGEDLEVTVEVENVGDVMMVGDDSQAIELVVGDDVVDTETVTVPWNETETIALSHETFPVQQDVEFLVEVRSEDDTEETTVSVLAEADPSLEVSIVETNDPVTGGDFLEVTATVENVGETETTQEIRLVVADDVADSQTVTVGAGESQPVSLGYETFPVRQDVSFSVQVTSEDDTAETTVDVLGTS